MRPALLLLLLASVAENALHEITVPSGAYQVDSIQNVEGSAIVLKSNLGQSDQNRLAAALTSIYQSISDPMQRLQQFQTETTKLYPVYWNVISNFANITYYRQYYIYLQIDSDRVLAFGIS
ncbi:hypothetical protein FQR65_LT05652 [Abscondita terminalis]|nr:hypothetical protein FQR65_LT05652 [Abscondita terminalis]